MGKRRFCVAWMTLLLSCIVYADAPPAVRIESAWARATPPGVTMGAAFMVITASTKDRLLDVSASIADRVEIHSMTMDDGMMQMRQGLAALQATGGEVRRQLFLPLLAEAYGGIGQSEEGLHVLAEALAAVEKTGGRFYEAELYRLRGELLLVRTAEHHTEAETCFRHALDIARRQQAKSWELRAAVSLSRLWHQQGNRAEARELLEPVHGWFTEGFETADLQDAKALLEELA